MAEDLRDFFERLATQPDEAVDVAEAALWVASIGRSDVDVDGARARLDALTERAREHLAKHAEPGEQVGALCDLLRNVEGFSGNEADYYVPENSFLDAVLEARRGIPIALGVIYIAVGKRLGLDIEGVNFPGRFLVRATLTDDAVLIVDPSEGVVLDEAALRERVSRALGSDIELTSEHLTAATISAIVMRMMNNLKVVYVHNGDPAAALGYCDWMVELVPDNPGELRDRAVLLEQIEAFEAAANDYEKVIALVRDASARRKLRRHVRELRRRVPKTLH